MDPLPMTQTVPFTRPEFACKWSATDRQDRALASLAARCLVIQSPTGLGRCGEPQCGRPDRSPKTSSESYALAGHDGQEGLQTPK